MNNTISEAFVELNKLDQKKKKTLKEAMDKKSNKKTLKEGYWSDAIYWKDTDVDFIDKWGEGESKLVYKDKVYGNSTTIDALLDMFVEEKGYNPNTVDFDRLAETREFIDFVKNNYKKVLDNTSYYESYSQKTNESLKKSNRKSLKEDIEQASKLASMFPDSVFIFGTKERANKENGIHSKRLLNYVDPRVRLVYKKYPDDDYIYIVDYLDSIEDIDESIKKSDKKALKEYIDGAFPIDYSVEGFEANVSNSFEKDGYKGIEVVYYDHYGNKVCTLELWDDGECYIQEGPLAMRRNRRQYTSFDDFKNDLIEYIHNLLHESIKKYLSSLNEANMSDEDKKDSEILRNIYAKLQKRSNARLTPEEQEVIDRLGLTRDVYEKNLTTKENPYSGPLFRKARRVLNPSYSNYEKVNFADRARKMGPRHDLDNRYGSGFPVSGTSSYDIGSAEPRSDEFIKMYGDGNWSSKPTYQKRERAAQDAALRKPIRQMKALLNSRKYHDKELATADARRDAKLADLEKEKQRILDQHEYEVNYDIKGRDEAQANIDKLLKRNKTESLRRNRKRGLKESYPAVDDNPASYADDISDALYSFTSWALRNREKSKAYLSLDDLQSLDKARDILWMFYSNYEG